MTTIAQGGEADAPMASVSTDQLVLRYFDEVLPLETRAINLRRMKINETRGGDHHRPPVQRMVPPHEAPEPRPGEPPYPSADPYKPPIRDGNASSDPPPPSGNPDNPDHDRTRPKPEPSDCTGLALSGGGIRSASFCLGVLQALHRRRIIDNIDYLSTVSGGGYVGASLIGGLSRNPSVFPFGDDVSDSAGVGHIRNYSNYLLPRGRSSLRNFAEAAVVILRGLIANAVAVLAFLVPAAWIFDWAFPKVDSLKSGGFLPRLADATLSACGVPLHVGAFLGTHPFSLTLWLAAVLAALLIYWVLVRSWNFAPARRPIFGLLRDLVAMAFLAAALTLAFMAAATIVRAVEGSGAGSLGSLGRWPALYALCFTVVLWLLAKLIRRSAGATQGDAGSVMLRIARWVFIAVFVSGLLDLVPLLVVGLDWLYEKKAHLSWKAVLQGAGTAATTFAAVVAFFSSRLGDFLKTTQRSSRAIVIAGRVLTRLVIYAASLVFPLVLLLLLLHLAAWGLAGTHVPNPLPEVFHDRMLELYGYVGLALLALILPVKPNAYSLHRFYRDRLAKAFLFVPANRPPPNDDLLPLDGFKLSRISDVDCPYHIVNAALNVQGSAEANRRGRNADFFIFTRDVVGSDLTMFAATDERLPNYAHTRDMEDVDSQLDLATAMAISGAAVSANMGSSTVRTLSPTLALLNIRLGYWLRNPRSLAKKPIARGVLEWLKLDRMVIRFYLLAEMLNLLDEKQRYVFLSDGGHIENLGVYELLKRGCQIIIAVDAEADPAMAFPSLMRLQRYARIDLGVRIDLPWQDIAKMTNAFSASLAPNSGSAPQAQNNGPHVAVGRITYATGAQGILVYIKSSMTGDERDYIIDYKKRNSDFPHETTGDQFFSEEQLEAYRALGFHAADGFFSQTQDFAWPQGIWPTQSQVMADVRVALV